MTKETLLAAIRDCGESVKNIIINEVIIQKKTRSVTFNFICDKTVNAETQNAVREKVNRFIPDSFLSLKINIVKVNADKEIVTNKILDYISMNFPSVGFVFNAENINVACGGGMSAANGVSAANKISAELFADGFTYEYLLSADINSKLKDYLERQFCSGFETALTLKESPKKEVSVKPAEIVFEKSQAASKRFISPSRRVGICCNVIEKDASYICDIKSEAEGLVICGKILSIVIKEYEDKKTKEKKSYFQFDLSDTTAKIICTFFPSQKNFNEIKALKAEDYILCEGKAIKFGGGLRFTAAKINYCKFPENFIQEGEFSLPAEAEYKLVKPYKPKLYVQENIFAEEITLECLLTNSFVVFDLETTGTSPFSDEITEIGAVRLTGGVITEVFHTLVNPKIPISEEITKLTGIDDKLVENAPVFADVAHDFFKFCGEDILVAHNIEFDYSFIKHHSKKHNYIFTNRGIDNLLLSREVLPTLANHKLNTIAEHYNLKFDHHRALNDALVTAEIFKRLLTVKKSLPKFF